MSVELVEAVVAAAKSMKNLPYKLGGRGNPKSNPPGAIDCRGFVERAYKLASAGPAIGDTHANVRGEVKWAKANERFREPSMVPGRAWLIFYNEPSAPPTPDNPDRIRHVALCLQPVSSKWPKGRAISALNPELDVRFHNLNLHGYAIYGYCEPDWSAVTDPEPPVEADPADIHP